jgi:dTDP-4-amino-4,6-dideoxygalactose transaminase
LDALQAAVLRVKLGHLEGWTTARRQNANCYQSMITGAGLEGLVKLPAEPAHAKHVYNQFVIRARDRRALRQHLQRAGIPSEIYYPYPLHLQRAFEYLGHQQGDFPEAEAACLEVLALPIFPELSEEQLKSVADAIASFYKRAS